MKLQDICPWGGLNHVEFRGLLADDSHCCSQKVLILRFALVKIVAGCLGSSWGTYCWVQESWEAGGVWDVIEGVQEGEGCWQSASFWAFWGIWVVLGEAEKLSDLQNTLHNYPIYP
jgi:hypothetical protein